MEPSKELLESAKKVAAQQRRVNYLMRLNTFDRSVDALVELDANLMIQMDILNALQQEYYLLMKQEIYKE